MHDLTIGQVIMSLNHIKNTIKDKQEIDALNVACNILESHYDWDMLAKEAVDWTHWR